jgi:hypothetical protein
MSDKLAKWRSIEKVCGITAFILFAIFWSMLFALRRTMPLQPDTLLGLTVPLTLNGRTVYINQIYEIARQILPWISVVFFFIAALIDVRINPFNRKLNK